MHKIRCSELVFDFDLYPRNNIDSVNTKSMIMAMEAKVEMPPVIVDKKSRRIVDGFHRVRAKITLDGEDSEITVIEKDYKSEQDMFADVMRYNSAHGARLDSADRVRCTIIAKRLGISIEKTAIALNMPADTLERLVVDRTATHKGATISLKRTVRRFAGRKLTEEQVKANDKLSGMNQSFYVNQLIILIESKMLDLEDENLMTSLSKLQELLNEVLVTA